MSDDENPTPRRPTLANADEWPDDTIKILLATDNHIGHMERDPIRGQDSINTFKEILQLAVKHDVDFILLAGDLFHENKPSRDCLYKTIALLREYTLGDKPVQVELLSNPDEGKAEGFSFPAINYEDPNFNVSIPVFSIHGNHDDPQGAGADGALCALDVISVSGLINYMGKIDLPLGSETDTTSTGIAVRPVLLRKGNTRLAMYGMGNIKDQRMHFELRSNRVRMYMPRDKSEWFNIMLLHQNRVKHGPQDFVPEGLFDDSLDLVIWGHEHDCRIVPEPVAGKDYYISQPGSSVATSLADGEAIEKHVALLQIRNKEFELNPIPLRTVRPFVIESIVLTEVAEEEGLDINQAMEIQKYLKRKVNELIDKAQEQWDARNERAVEEGDEPLEPMLPLIRLKVDTTDVKEMSNPVRFGQEFAGRIANPRDVLVFHRAKKTAARKGGKVTLDDVELEDPEEAGLSTSEKLARVRVSNLVKQYLEAQELQLLGEMEMSDAIGMFVEKDDIHAISTYVTKAFKKLTKSAQTNSEDKDLDDDDVEELLTKAKEQQAQEYTEKMNESRSKEKSKKSAARDKDDSDVDSMAMDEPMGNGSDFDSDPPPPKKKAPARGKGKAKAVSDDEDSDEPPPKKKAAAKKAPAKKAPAKKAPAKRGKKAVTESEEEEDDIIEVDSDSDAAPKKKAAPKKAAPKKKAAATQPTLSFAPARSSRAAASKARNKIVVDDSDDD
ncbi:Double-strand break repair protein MRE11 [Mycena kentingensis (nom. inval.)]|nr:Double-strand break repair protein MRE11 [Mycena kentingensis (nom. inval.)]